MRKERYTEVLYETENSVVSGKRTSNIYDVPGNENRHTSPNISCVSINIAKTKSTELNPPRTKDNS